MTFLGTLVCPLRTVVVVVVVCCHRLSIRGRLEEALAAVGLMVAAQEAVGLEAAAAPEDKQKGRVRRKEFERDVAPLYMILARGL